VTCWSLVPIKAPAHCKTRLRGVLSEAERLALVQAMLLHVLETASGAVGVDQAFVLGPEDFPLPGATRLLPDQGRGLNAELAAAAQHATMQGANRLLLIVADLPALTRDDVEALAAADANTIAIAPDRAGLGTNALSLPLPAASDFQFQFGPHSFERHRLEAIRLGCTARVVRSASLALDIDEPADLHALPPRFRKQD
jgi:2-phospho-L-lactate/phosphoenolpyruvate guanylyltransferase